MAPPGSWGDPLLPALYVTTDTLLCALPVVKKNRACLTRQAGTVSAVVSID